MIFRNVQIFCQSGRCPDNMEAVADICRFNPHFFIYQSIERFVLKIHFHNESELVWQIVCLDNYRFLIEASQPDKLHNRASSRLRHLKCLFEFLSNHDFGFAYDMCIRNRICMNHTSGHGLYDAAASV